MALHDNPPHRITIYGPPTAARDAGGGETITWGTTRQAAAPASINTASASTRELFAQQGIVVSHTIGLLTATLTSDVARGDKVTADDTGDTYIIRGISKGRAYGGIPPFTYLQVEQQL